MPQVKPDIETFAKIKVIGVGGSGGSAVDRMIKSGIRGVEFWAMNTDVQALHHNSAPHKLHIGKTVTRGLGAGMEPETGKRAAEEAQNEIREVFKETDMVFVTCGLGGGTGSGASPIIASIARDIGVLTIAVVTKPFAFEGPQRKAIADAAHEELARHVDAIITIPNDRVLQIIDNRTPLLQAFHIVDDVLRQGVQGISETITIPGLINVDFADVKAIMRDTGSALMGIGVAKGDNRAAEAAKAAISSPLLDLSIDGARGILFTITGGPSLGMYEASEAAKIITGSAAEDVKTIFGAVIDESMGEEVRITVIATGFDNRERLYAPPVDEFAGQPRKPLYGSSALFTKKKFSRIPPLAAETHARAAAEEAPRPSFSARPLSEEPLSVEPRAPFGNAADEEDLEIPAFIRKKMGM
jgi:cell division protein FtsZ